MYSAIPSCFGKSFSLVFLDGRKCLPTHALPGITCPMLSFVCIYSDIFLFLTLDFPFLAEHFSYKDGTSIGIRL
jgi:hypothetical protein